VGWPYPRIVAHRGGGSLAPENTLGAIRLGASLGFRGVEFDVMLAGDGTPVIIHDETTDRTTGVKGRVSLLPYSQLEKLDAGNGEIIPRYQKAAELCRALGLWANVEIKPAGGRDRATGEAVAAATRELWRGAALPPVLSSFSVVALEAAQATAPELPRGFLTDELPQDWESTVRRLGCISVHCNHEALTEQQATAVHKAGYSLACWTVNDPVAGRRLLEWGVDCLITDALRAIGPGFAQTGT
jgi:glycerophosphoryl diester phosphodiesterase